MKIGNRFFDLEHNVYIMGILNVTPDSFSDGGRYTTYDAAMSHAEEMIAEGADIIDVGGESTRPGYSPINELDEIDRVIPVIEGLRRNFDIPISIDTYKANVGELAICSGADLINDIWGFRKEPKLAKIAAHYQTPCCLMHNRDNMDYTYFLTNILEDLQTSIDIAKEAGLSPSQIILDPGIGFAKTMDQNLYVLKHLNKIKKIGYPVLLGASRKRVIGHVLDLPIGDRLEGTLATTAAGVLKGASIIRVHDVKANKRVAQMALAIREA